MDAGFRPTGDKEKWITLVPPRNHERHIAFVGGPSGTEVIQVALVRAGLEAQPSATGVPAHAPAALGELSDGGPLWRDLLPELRGLGGQISHLVPPQGDQAPRGQADDNDAAHGNGQSLGADPPGGAPHPCSGAQS